MSIRTIFFPDPDRSFRGERGLRTSIRTVHLAAMGILLGGHVYGVAPDRLRTALMWTVGSGSAFVALELFCNFHWLFQVRGILTLTKIMLVLSVPLFWDYRIWILLVVVAIGSVGSHLSTKFRHYSILTRDVRSHKKG